MTTSPSTFVLYRPKEGERIPEATFAYLRTRNRLRAFDVVQDQFEKAGLSQAALAVRMNKDPAQLHRLLSAPGNWTFDTFSDLLFAIAGGVPAYSVDFPLDKPIWNWTQPDWLRDDNFLAGGPMSSIVDSPDITVERPLIKPRVKPSFVPTFDDDTLEYIETPNVSVSPWLQHEKY